MRVRRIQMILIHLYKFKRRIFLCFFIPQFNDFHSLYDSKFLVIEGSLNSIIAKEP